MDMSSDTHRLVSIQTQILGKNCCVLLDRAVSRSVAETVFYFYG